ncbi:glycosyltransferase [Neptunitalea lumnitzerae]|uniref:Glycosyl transferase n=1 Tax=Neptunitalea lumnitzerae TaxID=2965509 RepID=A0ABQ5MN65_9FLAO|nr:glycosyltransferase [Neptunitalea sp. Y10]GLB50851.1 glycosyl transferase [Neptunitalea sp. Y10]
MRVVQLIDSLDIGGAERMAVNIANGLAECNHFSGLVSTRKEGELKEKISDKVSYLFLQRQKTLDIGAVLRLKNYLKQHKIEIIHAHSSSYFVAVLAKVFYPSVKIVWHDHYGKSEYLAERPAGVLKAFKFGIHAVISVNEQLAKWAREVVGFKKACYVSNFAYLEDDKVLLTKLKGTEGKRILCLANYRPQKDHKNLLRAFEQLHEQHPDWTLHLVGKNFNDAYADEIAHLIKEATLEDRVFMYGSRTDTKNILEQATIGVLASESEGLPLALLEYGLMKLPVVVTKVGECSTVVKNNENGLLVPPKNNELLCVAMSTLIAENDKRISLGAQLYETVQNHYGQNQYLQRLITIYEQA